MNKIEPIKFKYLELSFIIRLKNLLAKNFQFIEPRI